LNVLAEEIFYLNLHKYEKNIITIKNRAYLFQERKKSVSIYEYLFLIQFCKGDLIMHWLWVLIVGGVIGAIGGAITSKGKSMGIVFNIIAGLVGSAIGEAILGDWGPQVADMAIIPSVIGAVILIAVVSFFFGKK
jgi:uncharacterized membrane protein YeaQ/YmgE (transglycosylase-associated protein family)